MPVDVIMPALGMAQETGKVVRWLKADGATVAKGEPLLEVETDKVTVEIEAPADGTLAGVTAADGAEVPVGTVIALVLADGEALAEVPQPVAVSEPAAAASAGSATVTTPAPPHRKLASPKARRLAETRRVDLDALAGSGPNGAVVAADVEAAAATPALDRPCHRPARLRTATRSRSARSGGRWPSGRSAPGRRCRSSRSSGRWTPRGFAAGARPCAAVPATRVSASPTCS